MWAKVIFTVLLVASTARADENKEIQELIKDVLIPPSPERANDKLTVLEHTKILDYSINLTRVDYEIEKNTGEKQKGSLLLNGYPMNEGMRNSSQGADYWNRSEIIYNEVLPALEELLVEYQEEKRLLWTKVYGIRDLIIIQEDVEKNGNYTPVLSSGLGNPARLDMDHSKLVMSTLGKFHAMSAVLAERKKIPVDKLAISPFIDNGLINYYYLRPFRTLADTMEHYWGEEWAITAEKIRNLSVTCVTKIDGMLTDSKRDKNGFNVFNIGGCALDCILFQYRSDDATPRHVPEAMKFNCYRAAFYNSPAFDLQMFLSTSPNADVMLNKRDELIKIYHNSLVSNLQKFNYKGKIPELTYIENELKRTAIYGLGLSVSYLSHPNTLSPKEREELEDIMEKKWVETNEKVILQPEMMSKAFMEVMKGIIQRNLNENIF